MVFTDSPYASTDVLDAVSKISGKRWNCPLDDIGFIHPEVRKETQQRHGTQTHDYTIDFVVFNHKLEREGIVKSEDVKAFFEKQEQNPQTRNPKPATQ